MERTPIDMPAAAYIQSAYEGLHATFVTLGYPTEQAHKAAIHTMAGHEPTVAKAREVAGCR